MAGDIALLGQEAKLLLRYERDAWRRYRESLRDLKAPPRYRPPPRVVAPAPVAPAATAGACRPRFCPCPRDVEMARLLMSEVLEEVRHRRGGSEVRPRRPAPTPPPDAPRAGPNFARGATERTQ